jgi:hypothetical protein
MAAVLIFIQNEKDMALPISLIALKLLMVVLKLYHRPEGGAPCMSFLI